MLSLFGEVGYLNRFRYKLKQFLGGSPIQFNGKPFATWKILLLLLIVGLSVLSIPLVKELTRPPTKDEIAQKQYEKAKAKAADLSKTVAQQVQVPKDETPNVATVEDVTKLQDQDFFKKAKNGDKILIYEKAKLIVLYRPSEKKVIGTAPVLYNQPTPVVAGTSSASLEATPSAQ